jgi:soluble lytic murein transglycosylase-like protein
MGALDRWRAIPAEDRRYIGAAALGFAGVVTWALGIRTRLQTTERTFGDPHCPESVYAEVLTGLNATQVHRAWLYAPVIANAAIHWGVDPSLMMGLAHTESKFNPQAGSSKGAQGLMQIIPSTGRMFRNRMIDKGQWPFLELNLMDPEQSAWIGAKYIRDALRNRGSVEGALAAYNCGPVRCPKGSPSSSWPGETRNYIKGVPRRQQFYREIWQRCGSPYLQ